MFQLNLGLVMILPETKYRRNANINYQERIIQHNYRFVIRFYKTADLIFGKAVVETRIKIVLLIQYTLRNAKIFLWNRISQLRGRGRH